MNEFLASRWSERVQRLALGLEPTDAVRRGRIGLPVSVTFDGVPHPPSRTRRDASLGPFAAQDVLERIVRTDSCRHRLLLRPGLTGPVDVRITDGARRFVPRRLRVALPAGPAPTRIARPALYPGAAYPVPAGAVGCRGRVRIGAGGPPLRWARVEARRGDGTVVGRAQGDEHGEFLLLLAPGVVVGADLTLPLRATVEVFGPPAPPDPDAVPGADVDPLWDLPREVAAVSAAGEAVLAGTARPPGWVSRPGSVREVQFGLDGLRSEEFDFS